MADFLIYDPLFPRSVRRCLGECQAAVHAISGRPAGQPGDIVEQSLQDLIDWLDAEKIEGLFQDGLHEALTTVVNSIHQIGDAVHQTYFDPAPQAPPALSGGCGAAPGADLPGKENARPYPCQAAGSSR